ncbi:MAG: hypothetical protein HZA60_11195 [Deltaproteobacteria bacterium]|nr:hypothetical protein [Deltaproteobacteria bacterium]
MLFIVVAVLSISLLLAATDFHPRANPHSHFQKPGHCPKCHLSTRGKFDPDRFSAECDAFCLQCHPSERLGRSHPVNVRPRDKYWKMKIPDDFRLTDEGKMMCLTCHNAHGPFLSTVKTYKTQKPESEGSLRGSYYKTYFLRRSSPVGGFDPLCDACHKYL